MNIEDPPRRVLVVLGHGRTGGLGKHLLEVVLDELARNGLEHRVHDLLGDGFDPVLRLDPDQPHAGACDLTEDALAHRYQQDVRWAECYVILHPVWWFAPPAILKGWVDRVLVHGVALEQDPEGSPRPLLNGRRALVVQTFNAPRSVDAVLFRGIASLFWRRVVFSSVGIRLVARLALYRVRGVEPERLAKFEKRVRAAVTALPDGPRNRHGTGGGA